MTFFLGGNLISWTSQKQKIVALSSCEAEFMAATAAACQAIWLRNLISEITGDDPSMVTLYVDNKSAIALMKNPVFFGRSKLGIILSDNVLKMIKLKLIILTQ